jgi:hypothetical protein
MHLKVDEDLPTMATQRLREEGYEASSVLDQGMGGWKDPNLWQAVQEQGQFLVTADKGFGDIRRFPPGTHGGVSSSPSRGVTTWAVVLVEAEVPASGRA